MPCYYPLHAYKGKSEDSSKIKIVWKKRDSWLGEELELPCGQCIGCRLEKSRQWAVRCVHEASLYDRNCFLTLTYDGVNLPVDGSLVLDHFQLFMKRLRKKYGKGIRYFHCGEYGDELGRPHYHALLFNHDFEDKEFFSKSGENKLYVSDELDSLWKKGHGIIGDVTFESAGYVARYAMKKVTGENGVNHYKGKKPEYCTMSRRPGIGKRWYEKYKCEVYPRDGVYVNGSFSLPPKYYDGLLKAEDPQLLKKLKVKREGYEKFVENVMNCKDINGRDIVVSDSCDIRLLEKEKTKLAEIKLFQKRDGI